MADTDKPFHSKSEMKRVRVMEGKPMYPSDTDKLLAEIGERIERATPGPWHISAPIGSGYCNLIRDANNEEIASVLTNKGTTGGSFCDPEAQFIAHSRADIVKLKRMVECAKKHLAEHCLCSGDGQPDGVTCVHCDALAQLNAIARGEA